MTQVNWDTATSWKDLRSAPSPPLHITQGDAASTGSDIETSLTALGPASLTAPPR